MNIEKPWEVKSKIKQFKWTGKLITFKSKNIRNSIRRQFSNMSGSSFLEPNEVLPDIFLVLGFQTTRSTRTNIVVGELLLLGERKTVKFHLAPQYCTSEDVLIAALEMFFIDAKIKENDESER